MSGSYNPGEKLSVRFLTHKATSDSCVLRSHHAAPQEPSMAVRVVRVCRPGPPYSVSGLITEKTNGS
jgi:hypothetical protein